MANGEPVAGSLFVYAPNTVAPIVFALAYALSGVGHFWQCFRYKSFKIIGLHPFCTVMLTLGYSLRAWSSHHYIYDGTATLIVFILSQVFIYVCPPFLELANYHVLGRIFYYVPYFAPLPPGKVLSTFGLLMAIVETLNGIGVSLAANPKGSSQGLGGNLVIAAIVIQLAVILFFIAMAAMFQARCSRASMKDRAILIPLRTLYASMFLIFVRCIYRLVEHLGNTEMDLKDPESLRALSPILRYEWYFYVFEATLMLINSVLWNIWNPSRLLPRDYHVYLAPDGQTLIEGEEQVDERSFPQKIVSLVSFGFLFPKKENKRHFWELKDHPVVGARVQET